MLKGAIVRLLLFGIPFTFGYLASRPAAPAVKPAFVICAYADGQMKAVADASDCAAGATILTPAAHTPPGPTAPNEDDESADRTVHLPF